MNKSANKVSAKSLLKYGGLFLIILAFGGIIIGISRVFAKAAPCDKPNFWSSQLNKCVEPCKKGYHYDDNWNCILTCDAGEDYIPEFKNCFACGADSKGNATLDVNSNDKVRHVCPNGKNNCGVDCSKMQYFLPTDSTKVGKQEVDGQSFNCVDGTCDCITPTYEKCLLDFSDKTSNVCYDPNNAVCDCGDNKSGPCIVKPCNGLKCNNNCCTTDPAENDKWECCNNDSCCEKQADGVTSSCLPEAKNPDVSVCCNGDNKVVVTHNNQAACCDKDKVYCNNVKVSWNTKGVPSCEDGGDLLCCGSELCMNADGIGSCCSGSLCGNPSSLCGVGGDAGAYTGIDANSPLSGKCIGMILPKGDKCSKTNCENVCVKPTDMYASSFAKPDPKSGVCVDTNEEIRGVNYNKLLNDSLCTSNTDCVGYNTNVGTCSTFDPVGNSWESNKTCDSTVPMQAQEGICLEGCGGKSQDCGDSAIYCPADGGVCVCDSETNVDYCKDSETNWKLESEWPSNLKTSIPAAWGQIYDVDPTDSCPVGSITCTEGGKSCPQYKGQRGDPLPLTCESGKCVAAPEQRIVNTENGGKGFQHFCRTNYDRIKPPSNIYNSSHLSRMSMLSLEPAKGAQCTADNFGVIDPSVGIGPLNCGNPVSKTSISFPLYTNTSSSYRGPGKGDSLGNENPSTNDKITWNCGKNGNCNHSQRNGKPDALFNQTALQGKKWSAYNTKQWSVNDNKDGNANLCLQQAISKEDNSLLKLSHIDWRDNICTAEYEPVQTDGICSGDDGNAVPSICVSSLTNDLQTVDSGLICNNEDEDTSDDDNSYPGFIGFTNSNTHPSSQADGIYTCGSEMTWLQ